MVRVDSIRPLAALPGGELELTGSDLGPVLTANISGATALVTFARQTRATVKIGEGTLPGDLVVQRGEVKSKPVSVEIGVPMAENLHPVANPAVDMHGAVYTTLSGGRGQQTPVSVFRIAPAPRGMTHEVLPLVRDILNPTGLAFSQAGDLYVSSRADGIVYRIVDRIDRAGNAEPFAEGLGVATGIAFDAQGDLYVGDRSGTIFKIQVEASGQAGETFVFATLEPSIAAYHLGFDSRGMLYVTAPTTASSQSVYAIDPQGRISAFYRGLGRAQGFAFDRDDNLYVAASLNGERGIVRIGQNGAAELVVSGPNLVGLCFLPGGRAALATRDAVYEVHLGVYGMGL
jgi:sugar lactone lactonase YvrE